MYFSKAPGLAWIRRSMLRHNLRTDAAWTGLRRGGSMAACLLCTVLWNWFSQTCRRHRCFSDLNIYGTAEADHGPVSEYRRVHALIGQEIPKESNAKTSFRRWK
ncbi:MAG: hypothetical protein H6569_06715 [Lewinellaceae bacterium]|nr:hypothetical protein [Lewinellaceae bacterium]